MPMTPQLFSFPARSRGPGRSGLSLRRTSGRSIVQSPLWPLRMALSLSGTGGRSVGAAVLAVAVSSAGPCCSSSADAVCLCSARLPPSPPVEAPLLLPLCPGGRQRQPVRRRGGPGGGGQNGPRETTAL